MKKPLVLLISSVLSLTGCFNQGNGLEISKSDGANKLRRKGEEEGYKIDFTYKEGKDVYKISTGMKGNVSWYIRDNKEGIALKNNGDYYHTYFYNNGTYNYMVSYRYDVFETMFLTGSMLFKAHDLQGVKFTKEGDVKVLDRDATSYSFKYQIPSIGTELNYKVAIDNEFGITLKIECVSLGRPENQEISFEATSFYIGKDVVAPEIETPTIIIDANEISDLTKVEVPTNIHVKYTLGEGTGIAFTLEIVGDKFYAREHFSDEELGMAYYGESKNGEYTIYRRNYDDDEGWKVFDVSRGSKIENIYSAFAWINFADLFDMNNLHDAGKIGTETINGYPTTVYQDSHAKYYLADQYKMFLKIDFNKAEEKQWNREVTELHQISSLTDTPDHPAVF